MQRLGVRIKNLLRHMTSDRGENGAVLAFVAIGIVVLLGSVAMSVDAGRMYNEKRELQNGADAAALAVATECAFGNCGSSSQQYATAEVYADANASDSLAWADDVTVDLGAQTARVHTSTEDPGGDHHFDMLFAQMVGFNGLTVGAEATVAWGSPAGLSTLPIIFSVCEWEKYGASAQPSSAVTDGLLPPTLGYPTAPEIILFHGGHEPCHESPSGQDLPGGFGWLETTGTCSADIDAGNWVGIDPGASPSNGCSASYMEDLVGTVQLIPYFDDVVGTGNTAQYHVLGFGALYITGYNFAGQYKEQSLWSGAFPCNGSDRCLEGYFIKDWVVDEGTPGGGADLGVVVIGFVD